MKWVLPFLLIFNIGTVFAENTVIAIVNNSVITYNSIETNVLNSSTNEHKVGVVNKKIDSILQLQKAKELNAEASKSDILPGAGPIGALFSSKRGQTTQKT